MQGMQSCSITEIHWTSVSGNHPPPISSQQRDDSKSPRHYYYFLKSFKAVVMNSWCGLIFHCTQELDICAGEKVREEGMGHLPNVFFKKGEIEMHRESSAIHLPRPVSRLSYSQPTLSGVYHNRGTACEYLSCNVVPVELCVRKRWFTVGVWWDWGEKNSYCRHCHKMFISNHPDGWVYGTILTRHAKEILCHHRAWACICISLMWTGTHWQLFKESD